MLSSAVLHNIKDTERMTWRDWIIETLEIKYLS